KGGKAKGYAYSKQRQEARRLHKRGKKATDIAKLTGLSIRSVYNAINESKSRKTAIKTEKTNVQENEFKNIKYQILKPIFNANNYQCSVFSVKELRSNSPFVCERSELQSLNLLFLKQNTQTILLANRNFYFCFSPPQITHDLI
ncbi:hypothetical protein CU320_15470, partial [Acinetobacter pseudolwoffii]